MGAAGDAAGAAGGVAGGEGGPQGPRPRRPGHRPPKLAGGAHGVAAIVAGSSAPKIELAAITAEQPSSIARAASDAVPTPASRITGTCARSAMIATL